MIIKPLVAPLLTNFTGLASKPRNTDGLQALNVLYFVSSPILEEVLAFQSRLSLPVYFFFEQKPVGFRVVFRAEAMAVGAVVDCFTAPRPFLEHV